VRLPPALPSLGSIAILIIAVVLVVNGSGDGDTGRGGQGGPGSTASAVVTRVVDGDTVEVSLAGDIEDVRYIGVDTPETVKPGAPVECYGPEAHDFNERLVDGETVRLDFDAVRRDVYGRLLAYVRVGDEFINAELVRKGYATTLTIPPNDRYASRFAQLERQASAAGVGLWGEC
jgi:micrococcal nuclease